MTNVALWIVGLGDIFLLGAVAVVWARVAHLRGLLREVAVERDRLLDEHGRLRAENQRLNVALTTRSEFVQHGMDMDGDSDRP